MKDEEVNLPDFLQKRRVTLGWVLAAAFVVFARPTPGAIAAGTIPLVLGAAVRAWAAGHIRKSEELATGGPYAHTRNPLYFGSFLMMCGALIMGRNGWLAAVSLLLAIPVYFVVIRKEEGEIAAVFGQRFADYTREVPRFFPRLLLTRRADSSFNWGLLRRNREWRAWVGAVLLTLFMLARWFWSPGR